MMALTKRWEAEWLEDKVREIRLRRFGHVQRRHSGYIGLRMLKMELPGKPLGRLGAVKNDMHWCDRGGC